MPDKYAPRYIDQLLASETYDDLATLSSMVCASVRFQPDAADYGLPQFAFLFVETLLWFAQGARSGVWTYYEGTLPDRQTAMLASLTAAAPHEFSQWYEQGMRTWDTDDAASNVDDWMTANDDVANAWMRTSLRRNRDALFVLLAT